MTIPVLFEFIKTAIVLLSITAMTLSFYFFYKVEPKRKVK